MTTTPFEVQEIQAKSILSPATLKDVDYDYSINPYTGCRFSCVYCYASFMARMVGRKTEEWGNFVYPKMNAPELLNREIKKLRNNGEGKVIWFSSVTDPYQGIEAKYRLTRQCLEVLIQNKFRGKVSFLTKSDLILRDADLIKQLPDTEVGMTITSTDDGISRYFEKYAPSVLLRLRALRALNDEGINTYAFVGPLLPHYVANEQTLEGLFKSVKAAGVTELFIEHLNLSPYILKRLKNELPAMDKAIWSGFYESQDKGYRKRLDEIVLDLVERYGFHLRMGSTLYHKEMS